MCLLQASYEIVNSAVAHSLWFWTTDSLVSLPAHLNVKRKQKTKAISKCLVSQPKDFQTWVFPVKHHLKWLNFLGKRAFWGMKRVLKLIFWTLVWAQPQLTHRVDNSLKERLRIFTTLLFLEVQGGTALYPYKKVGNCNNDSKTQQGMNWHRPRSSATGKIQKSNANEI